ncbi:unnamed protein product [Ceutorhynchus assimilis]|uniref:Uncharacterized protein n=1 Tax=Ceutorhynchus assimilis TaxID=467358 RepID=A0A9N9QS65_9CUCU|nr:unnamed protein product [Ceutorhynchus assimilis]
MANARYGQSFNDTPLIHTRKQPSDVVNKRNKRVVEMANKFLTAIAKSSDYENVANALSTDHGLSKDLVRRVIALIKKKTDIRPKNVIGQFKTIRENFLSQSQFDKMVEYAIVSLEHNTEPDFSYYAAIFLLCAFTGKRLNEILSMTKFQLEKLRDKQQIAIYISKTNHIGQVKWNGPNDLLGRVVARLIGQESNPPKFLNPYEKFNKHWTNVFGTTPPHGIKFHSLRYKNVGRILLSHDHDDSNLEEFNTILDELWTYATLMESESHKIVGHPGAFLAVGDAAEKVLMLNAMTPIPDLLHEISIYLEKNNIPKPKSSDQFIEFLSQLERLKIQQPDIAGPLIERISNMWKQFAMSYDDFTRSAKTIAEQQVKINELTKQQKTTISSLKQCNDENKRLKKQTEGVNGSKVDLQIVRDYFTQHSVRPLVNLNDLIELYRWSTLKIDVGQRNYYATLIDIIGEQAVPLNFDLYARLIYRVSRNVRPFPTIPSSIQMLESNKLDPISISPRNVPAKTHSNAIAWDGLEFYTGAQKLYFPGIKHENNLEFTAPTIKSRGSQLFHVHEGKYLLARINSSLVYIGKTLTFATAGIIQSNVEDSGTNSKTVVLNLNVENGITARKINYAIEPQISTIAVSEWMSYKINTLLNDVAINKVNPTELSISPVNNGDFIILVIGESIPGLSKHANGNFILDGTTVNKFTLLPSL